VPDAVAIDLPVTFAVGLADAVAFADGVALGLPITVVRSIAIGEPEPGCLTDAERARAAR